MTAGFGVGYTVAQQWENWQNLQLHLTLNVTNINPFSFLVLLFVFVEHFFELLHHRGTRCLDHSVSHVDKFVCPV